MPVLHRAAINSNVSTTCLHNMVNFGPLAAEICLRVWGTPVNVNGFRLLAALVHGTYWWASAEICGVKHRAPPTFCTAAVMLCICQHFKFTLISGDFTLHAKVGLLCIILQVFIVKFNSGTISQLTEFSDNFE